MKRNILKWLWVVSGRGKLYVAGLLLAQILNGASGVMYSMILRGLVDAAAAHEPDGLRHYVILLILLVTAQITVRAVIRWLEELSRATLENRFKERLLSNILSRDFAAVNAVHSGEWLNRLTGDCMIVANHFTEILPGLSGMTVKLFRAVIMIIILEPRFAAFMLPAGVLLLILATAFRKKIKQLHKRIQEADGRLRIFLQERIGSLMMIRSFAAEPQTAEDAEEKLRAHKAARMRRNRFSNFCNIGFQSGMEGMYLFGACWCVWGIYKGTISFGTMTAMTQLIAQIQSPFANITGYLPRFYAMTASAERLAEIEDFADDIGEAPKTPAEIQTYYRDEFAALRLSDVSFTYLPASDTVKQQDKSAMPAVLRHLDLTLKKGEYAAFTGHSGCGKSTVLKLLSGVYRPDAGECLLVSRSGAEIPAGSAWRRLFAYVPQGNQLMSGTIRGIVSFADPAAAQDEARLARALRIACAADFVAELEQGADTVLGERGTGLSEGQMQRIAIARAVFADCPVMLLDEATSALDEATERQVLHNLREMTDKTVLIVTHRPAALSICDRVIAFTEQGAADIPPQS